MAQLAIKGHPTRGKEVIEILEMFGGKSNGNMNGYNDDLYYYIAKYGLIYGSGIEYEELACNYSLFTLEEFEEKFPYKVGDCVVNHKYGKGDITQMLWINNEIVYEIHFEDCMAYCKANELCKYDVFKGLLSQELKEHLDNATPEQLEEDWKELEKLSEVGPIADEYVKQCKEDNKAIGSRIDFSLIERIELDLGDTHEVVVENGKTYVVKKKPAYPKTYEECCKVLDIQSNWHLTFELNNTASCDLCVDKEFKYVCNLEAFRKLLICRDAYWKVYGEQMGLGKLWEYDMSKDEFVYAIVYQYGYIQKCEVRYKNHILAFPTKEMRDAFYENFKGLINECKELL